MGDTIDSSLEDNFTSTDEPRMTFKDYVDPKTSGYTNNVLKVSRATTHIKKMTEFYTSIIPGEVLNQGTLSDGTHYVHIKINGALTHIHLVNRPASSTSGFTVRDHENYMNLVHDEYILSPECGFDQFADHHWGFSGGAFQVDETTATMDSHGYKYKIFHVGKNHYQMYLIDPSGWSFQVSGPCGDLCTNT